MLEYSDQLIPHKKINLGNSPYNNYEPFTFWENKSYFKIIDDENYNFSFPYLSIGSISPSFSNNPS